MRALPLGLTAGIAICGALLLGEPASAQQFSPVDYVVMQRICGPFALGFPCVYDSHNQIVGLSLFPGELQRRIGGEWYQLLYHNIGFPLPDYSFFFTSDNCTGTAYLETGSGQKSGTTLVEQLPFYGAVTNNEIWGPVGAPIQIQIGSEATSPAGASIVSLK